MHFLSKRIKIQGFLSFLTLPGTVAGSRATSKERGKQWATCTGWFPSWSAPSFWQPFSPEIRSRSTKLFGDPRPVFRTGSLPGRSASASRSLFAIMSPSIFPDHDPSGGKRGANRSGIGRFWEGEPFPKPAFLFGVQLPFPSPAAGSRLLPSSDAAGADPVPFLPRGLPEGPGIDPDCP